MATTGEERRTWRDPQSPRSLALWFPLVVPPLAWGAQVVLGDLIYELGCAAGVRGQRLFGLPFDWWALAASAVFAAVTVAALAVALGAWSSLGRRTDGTSWDRARAMAYAGVASAILYLLLIAFGFFPMFFLETCATSP